MENIITLENIKKILSDIIHKEENFEEFQKLLISLHFNIQQISLCNENNNGVTFETLEQVSIYLLSYLTNIKSKKVKEHVKDYCSEALNIAALIFELLVDSNYLSDLNTKQSYFFYCAVCYSLAEKEANSLVVSRRLYDFINKEDLKLYDDERQGWNFISLTLSRRFKDLYKNRSLLSSLNSDDFWNKLNIILIENAIYFIDGINGEGVFVKLNELKKNLLEKDDIENLLIVSLLYDVLAKMHEKSVWHILPSHGFSNLYIHGLTKFFSENKYELWKSQIDALNAEIEGKNFLDDAISRVLITMPTSSGKTFIAELAIIKELLKPNKRICIYVANTRALTEEIEQKFFLKFRKLGYKIQKFLDTDKNTFEEELINETDLIVCTPEKLDLIVRMNRELLNKIGLIIFDEFHKISDGTRGWFLETLITYFMINQDIHNYKLIFMSAIIGDNKEIKFWLGNECRFITILSKWSPTRRLYGIFEADISTKLKYFQLPCKVMKILENKIDINKRFWTKKDLINELMKLLEQSDVERIVNKKVEVAEIPYDLQFKYLEERRIIKRAFISEDKYKISKGNRVKTHDSNTRFDRCYKVINILKEQQILIYFHTKNDLNNFINVKYLKKYKELKSNNKLLSLESFLSSILTKEHPLVKSILYGVAYHHGDLPFEVREKIEKAYKNGTINILACTTTLADGINLHIKNFILGCYFAKDDNGKIRYTLSLENFKNIIGRVGRANNETEGRIFLIKNPEDEREYLDKLLVYDTLSSEVISTLKQNENYKKIILQQPDKILTEMKIEKDVDETSFLELDLIANIDKSLPIEQCNELQTFLERLQNFIFILYEELKDKVIIYEDFCKIMNELFLSTQEKKEQLEKFYNFCFQYYTKLRKIPFNILNKYNKTGLSLRSNIILDNITNKLEDFFKSLQRYINICFYNVYPSLYFFIIEPYLTNILSPSLYLQMKNIINKNIFEELLTIREAKPKSYTYGKPKKLHDLNHYELFLDWLYGKSFVEIRDTYFKKDKNNISNRTNSCVQYIHDMFLYKLPWIFNALIIIAQDKFKPEILNMLNNLSAKVKYGVNNEYELELCILGIRSRELAIKLAQLYNERKKYKRS